MGDVVLHRGSGQVAGTTRTSARSNPLADLLAAISHEIRTPLNAVIGFCQLIRAEIFGPVGDPRYSAYVGHIADGGEALLKSTEDTLALTALLAEQGECRPRSDIWLNGLVNEGVTLAARRADACGIRLAQDVPGDLSVYGDLRTYRQIVSNLVLEAVAHARSGGRVGIAAEHRGDMVMFTISAAPRTVIPQAPAAPSFALSIARALLELDGGRLKIDHNADSGLWRATLWLEPALQADLFLGRA